jgi:nicotinamide-nucleotide adenylyltransferase
VRHRIGVTDEGVAAAIERAREPGPPRLEVVGGPAGNPGTVGLVAGSFDPMTRGHEALAEALRTDLTLMIWSPQTLPKEEPTGEQGSPPRLEPEVRLVAVLAWCLSRPNARLAVCSHGLLVDQVEAAARTFPEARFVVGVGSDKLRQIFDPAWYEDRDAALKRLFRRAVVAYSVRTTDRSSTAPRIEGGPGWRPRLRLLDLPSDVAGLSSSGVREAIRRGQDVSGAVPREVLPFLEAAGGPR